MWWMIGGGIGIVAFAVLMTWLTCPRTGNWIIGMERRQNRCWDCPRRTRNPTKPGPGRTFSTGPG